jgi:hypothetical protein
MHPGDHVRPGDALEQVPGIGDGDGPDKQLLSLPILRHKRTF